MRAAPGYTKKVLALPVEESFAVIAVGDVLYTIRSSSNTYPCHLYIALLLSAFYLRRLRDGSFGCGCRFSRGFALSADQVHEMVTTLLALRAIVSKHARIMSAPSYAPSRRLCPSLCRTLHGKRPIVLPRPPPRSAASASWDSTMAHSLCLSRSCIRAAGLSCVV
jgi:hypothetical protein